MHLSNNGSVREGYVISSKQYDPNMVALLPEPPKLSDTGNIVIRMPSAPSPQLTYASIWANVGVDRFSRLVQWSKEWVDENPERNTLPWGEYLDLGVPPDNGVVEVLLGSNNGQQPGFTSYRMAEDLYPESRTAIGEGRSGTRSSE